VKPYIGTRCNDDGAQGIIVTEWVADLHGFGGWLCGRELRGITWLFATPFRLHLASLHQPDPFRSLRRTLPQVPMTCLRSKNLYLIFKTQRKINAVRLRCRLYVDSRKESAVQVRLRAKVKQSAPRMKRVTGGILGAGIRHGGVGAILVRAGSRIACQRTQRCITSAGNQGHLLTCSILSGPFSSVIRN
jgi:hypothetical protein